jgi:hypothetical protein
MSKRRSHLPPPVVALVAWLVPGAGYWVIGQTARAVTVGATIVALFVLGIFLAGIRVIEVPGYDDAGLPVHVDHVGVRLRRTDPGYAQGNWVLTSGGLVAEIANKPWYIPQIVAGPITLATSALSVKAAQAGVSRVHARLMDVGVLYTAIAGMLNLLAIIDSAHRASIAEEDRG